MKKESSSALVGGAQWSEHWPAHWRVTGLIPRSRACMYLGCRFNPSLVSASAQGNQLMCLSPVNVSLSSSLPSFHSLYKSTEKKNPRVNINNNKKDLTEFCGVWESNRLPFNKQMENICEGGNNVSEAVKHIPCSIMKMIKFLVRSQDRKQNREVVGKQAESTEGCYAAPEYGP